jgi:hypothetical protein
MEGVRFSPWPPVSTYYLAHPLAQRPQRFFEKYERGRNLPMGTSASLAGSVQAPRHLENVSASRLVSAIMTAAPVVAESTWSGQRREKAVGDSWSLEAPSCDLLGASSCCGSAPRSLRDARSAKAWSAYSGPRLSPLLVRKTPSSSLASTLCRRFESVMQ